MRLMPFLLACALMLPVAAQPAGADDEPPAKADLVWVFRRGEEERALDVGHLDASLREAVRHQLEAQGWQRVLPTPAESPAPAAAPVSPAPAPSSLERDLEELVRRGGRLPEGFVPHGMGAGSPWGGLGVDGAQGGVGLGPLAPAFGRLLLDYLDAKSDPVKGPIYEELLRDVGTVLVEGGEGGMAPLAARMLGRFVQGMRDPAKAAVYQDLMRTLGGLLTGATGGEGFAFRSSPVPPPPPHAQLGGAVVAWPPDPLGGAVGTDQPGPGRVFLGTRAGGGWLVLQVPDGSTASQASLRAGDLLVALDGLPPTPALLARADRVLREGGKLRIELRRIDGKTELLELEIVVEEAARGR